MNDLYTALDSSNTYMANNILNGRVITPELRHLRLALMNKMYDIANRLMDEFNVEPDTACINIALMYGCNDEMTIKLVKKSSPTVVSLNLAVDYFKYDIAKEIIKKGVYPDNRHLNRVLDNGAYESAKLDNSSYKFAKHIYENMAEESIDADTLKLFLEHKQYDIAQQIIESGVRPNENYKIVKDFMDHIRGMRNLRGIHENLSSKLKAFSINQTPENLDTIRKTLKVVLDNHYPFNRGKSKNSQNRQRGLRR